MSVRYKRFTFVHPVLAMKPVGMSEAYPECRKDRKHVFATMSQRVYYTIQVSIAKVSCERLLLSKSMCHHEKKLLLKVSSQSRKFEFNVFSIVHLNSHKF